MWKFQLFLLALLWYAGFFLMYLVNIPWLFLVFTAISISLQRLKLNPRAKWLCGMLATQGLVPFITNIHKTFGTLSPYDTFMVWNWPPTIAAATSMLIKIIGIHSAVFICAGSLIFAGLTLFGTYDEART